MRILVTGGAGYIGSHTIIELILSGHEIIIVDNLSNSDEESVKRVEHITGKIFPFFKVDCTDEQQLSEVFAKTKPEAVIHFAALKAVGESVAQPLAYYKNNLDSTLVLCEVMQKHDVKKLVFSSSATVYGTPVELPLRETSRIGEGITNPYGQTKYMIEQILLDLKSADPDWQITILRYFNPIGAHESGLIGEDPQGMPNNLLPYVAQVAVGKRPFVNIFGNDYDTTDGTGVRDYIHVVDLAKGHVAAVEHLAINSQVNIYNLGTGQGTSVMGLIRAFEKACGHKIPYEIVSRRPGDVAICYADASKAKAELGWVAEKSVEDACRDSWKWQSDNPSGFKRDM